MKILACLLLVLSLSGCSKLNATHSFGVSYDPETKVTEVITPAPIEPTTHKDTPIKDKVCTPIPEEEYTKKLIAIANALDKFLQGKAILLLLFIFLQWIHLLYYTKTGKTSSVLCNLCTKLWNSMSIATKLLYKYIKHKHYKKHVNYPRLPK